MTHSPIKRGDIAIPNRIIRFNDGTMHVPNQVIFIDYPSYYECNRECYTIYHREDK